MRKSFATALITTVLFGGGYLYYVAGSVCPAPLTYQIGSIDERFNMSEEEVRLAIGEAESVWEDATGKNLFTADDEGVLSVNFVYDERQELSNSEDLFKEKLDATETVSDAMRDTYATLVNEYNAKRLEYTQKAEAYDARLSAYNLEVEKYNGRGGAPTDVYARLEEEKRQLSLEQNALNAYSAKLNALVSDINSVGEKANRIINTYNQGVDTYNKAFGTAREFTQGDYSQGVINIYTFDSKAELVLVLVHELGHALSLDHVENSKSVMHYLLHEGQEGGAVTEEDVVLSAEDLAEFNRVCGQKTFLERLKMGLSLVRGEV